MTKRVLLFSVIAATLLSGCESSFYLDEGCHIDEYSCDSSNGIYQCVEALLSHNFSEQRKLRIHNRFSHLRYEVIVENFV